MEGIFGSGRRALPMLAMLAVGTLLAVAVCVFATSVAAPEAQAQTTKASPLRNPDSILGKPRFSEQKALRYAKSKGATKYMLRAIPLYYDLAPRVGIAPDVLIAQSMVETGYGRYGGAAKPWNMAGIKKGGNVGDEPRDFERPANAYTGVRMHVNHMAVYTNRETVGKPHDRLLRREVRAAEPGVLDQARQPARALLETTDLPLRGASNI